MCTIHTDHVLTCLAVAVSTVQDVHKLSRSAFPAATYTPASALSPSSHGKACEATAQNETADVPGAQRPCWCGLQAKLDDPTVQTPWVADDIADPALAAHLQPFTVTLNRGDVFYLPALWWHRVAQKGDGEGSTIAVNYWYESGTNGYLNAQHGLLEQLMVLRGKLDALVAADSSSYCTEGLSPPLELQHARYIDRYLGRSAFCDDGS